MRKLGLLFLACLIVALPSLPAEAKQRPLSLQKPFSLNVPLRAGSREVVRLRTLFADGSLEVKVGKSVQRFGLPTLASEFARGEVLVGDFNFDGWTDFTIPQDIGYGGVNYFHALYVFNPSKRSFQKLPLPGENGPDWCNPVLNAKTRVVQTECKSGPAWYGLDYRFERGQPKLHIQADPAILSGLSSDDEMVFLLRVGDAVPVLSDDMHAVVPIVRALPVDRADLFDAPRQDARSKRYIVKGDRVRVLEVLPGGWCKIEYQSRTAGRLVKWINLPEQEIQLLPLR